MFTLLYIGMIAGVIGVHGLDIQPLPDGIIVSQGDNITIIEGEWTLLLTIHEDGMAHQLAAHARLVEQARDLWINVISVQNISLFFTTQRRALMRAKIDLVVSANHGLQYNLTTSRERRGLIDFIGQGLNWAFGTATEAQVEQLQAAVDQARGSQKAIVHNVRELITVINQTHVEMRDTRVKLATLATAYDQFMKMEGDRWSRFDHNTKLLMMEQYLDSLLWLDTSVWRQIDTTRQLHRSLRAGELTGELCPVLLLNQISQLAATHGLQSLPTNWYYENIPVEPLMIKEGLMTFRVTLPYTDDRLYQRYDIQTFAVPLDDTGSRARVQVQDDIAMDTTDGYWFAPTLCTGRRPQLCHAGPRWGDAYPCERGLITGYTPDREQCVITTTRTDQTTAQELQEGLFVLQTLGENVKLACKGKRQVQTTLQRGVYRLHLGEGCTLSGGRWSLKGMIRRYITATARMRTINIPPLDIAAMIPVDVTLNDSRQYQVHLDLKTRHEHYQPNYVGMNNDNDVYPEVLIAHHLSWTAIGLIIILCVLGGIGGIWLYWHRQKIRFFFADALLARVKAKQVEKAIKYSAKAPESVEIGGASGHDGEDVEEQQIV